MFVSLPVADIAGSPEAAAFVTVISLTAEPVAVNLIDSFPFVSNKPVSIFGDSKVLFVNVSVPVI